jgi:hypothetical protein
MGHHDRATIAGAGDVGMEDGAIVGRDLDRLTLGKA